MQIIENAIPDGLLNVTKLYIEESNVPWYFLPNSASDKCNDYLNYSFQHTPFVAGKILIQTYYDVTNSVANMLKSKFDLNDYYVDRLRWGMTTSIGKKFVNQAHIDTEIPHKTILFYIHDSDGETFFYNNKQEVIKKVMPKTNRAILFDGSVFHASSKPVKIPKRIVLNINLIKKENKK